MSRAAVACWVVAMGALLPGRTAAQDVRAALGADTIQVGDVVPVAIRIDMPRDRRVAWPDTLPLADPDLENASRVRTRVDTLDDGRLRRTAIYAVTPWRTGDLVLPDVPIQVVGGDEGVTTTSASLPTLSVSSVLPEDTVGIEPKPAKDVIGPNWAWWPILLLLLLLAAILAAILWWLRRRRGEAVALPLEPAVSPRERALAILDQAREAGLVERGELKAFYTRISDAVRHYAAALDASWGEDLTTTELLGRFRAQAGPGASAGLAEVLRPADQVKFARRHPGADVAIEEWERARSWVLEFDWPPRPVEGEVAA
jgi:hypothetical protein